MNKIDRLKRDKLVDLCKKKGIKANISTRDMRMCLKNINKGKAIESKYKKLNWFQQRRNQKKMMGAFAFLCLAIFTALFIKRRNYW